MDYIIIIRSNFPNLEYLNIKNSFESIINNMNRSKNKEKSNESK
jgi:RNase P protein component